MRICKENVEQKYLINPLSQYLSCKIAHLTRRPCSKVSKLLLIKCSDTEKRHLHDRLRLLPSAPAGAFLLACFTFFLSPFFFPSSFPFLPSFPFLSTLPLLAARSLPFLSSLPFFAPLPFLSSFLLCRQQGPCLSCRPWAFSFVLPFTGSKVLAFSCRPCPSCRPSLCRQQGPWLSYHPCLSCRPRSLAF